MEESPERRRLSTPSRREARAASRSRSRLRLPSSRRLLPDSELRRERLLLLEREVQFERDRLRASEERHASRANDERRSRSRQRRSSSRDSRRSRAADRDAGRRIDAGYRKRSRSPSFSKRDLIDIFKQMRDGLTLPPVPQGAQQPLQKIDHKNILPDFDPSTKNQKIDIWLKKVNECASVYGWDERTTTHFAMQKLQGLAKTWYQSLNTILFTWPEWQEKLIRAFPCEQNYGQTLEDMIKRKSKFNEPIEVYYYEKLSLVNQCEIEGRRAVDCIIHGLSDRGLRLGALALRCSQPDQLLQYLLSNKDSNQFSGGDRVPIRSKNFNNTNVNNSRLEVKPTQPMGCYNCKEKGHSFLYCPKPLVRCTQCNKVGHTAEKCYSKIGDKPNKTTAAIGKTMRIDHVDKDAVRDRDSKFIKDVQLNDVPFKAFIDFGSDVTLVRESAAKELGVPHDNVLSFMKGFGNGIVQSLGGLTVNVSVDGVDATVLCKVVSDHLLEMPVLIGQSFTEQPHISAYKNVNKLQFFNVGNELPHPAVSDDSEKLLSFSPAGTVEIFGPASVRIETKSLFDGNVLVKNCVAGKPSGQYFIAGGLHRSVNGRINVLVIPCSDSCLITSKLVFCRAERVDVVNRLIVDTPIEMRTVSTLDKNQVKVSETASEGAKQNLLVMLERYQHCFASSLKDIGCTNAAEMNIELNNQRPVVYRPYRLSHHEREKVRSMVADMLDAGIVRESVSNYASPILLVRKKDGSPRLCVDFRMLNSVTVKERYPMPIIEDEIARLAGQGCFITLDLTSGYYQVPISEHSKHLTSFVTPDGQYEFNRMPFGLANAPAVFQRMINTILGSARFNKATAYIDDILIFGKDSTECLERLEEVLQVIEKANLTLNLSKCEFLRSKIDYLGYEISASGVRPGENKILSVMKFPRPVNVHGVRQFLGLASYFRKFIKDFAQISSPLCKLLKKDVAWEWTDIQERAFETLKGKLIDRPVLAIYDPAAEFELHTDASKVGVGGILLQRSPGSDALRPVAYYSRQTSPEEKNFHSYELETLAVVCSLRKFRVYLLGMEFKIVTDCSALRSTFSKRDIIPRIARWWLTLQEFNCTIEYRAGIKMSHVDALSRNPVVESSELVRDQFPAVMSISGDDWLHTLQIGDSELRRIRDILSSDLDEKSLRYIKNNYVIKDNKLFRILEGNQREIRWVVPKGARWQLCRLNHDEIGHFGVEKTLERIRKQYWFPKMSRFVKKYVSACIECAYSKNNTSAREGLLHPIEKVEIPFHTLHMDHLGPFVKSNKGYTHLFVVVDGFTKFCFLKPVRNTNTQNVIRSLEDIFSTFRNPNRIISDRGSCFTSHTFKRFCLDKGVKHVLNTVASPRSNGQVERYNRTILDSLKSLCIKHGEKSWDDHLGKIQWGLNNTIQKTIGKTPSEVMFGTCMNSEVKPALNETAVGTCTSTDRSSIHKEVKARIDSEQNKQKDSYDKGRKPAHKYSEGDLVKITKTCFNSDGQSKKLMPSFIGPYRVTKILGKDRYSVAPIPGLKITESRRPTTVAADRMKPWIHLASLHLEDSDSSDGNDEDLY